MATNKHIEEIRRLLTDMESSLPASGEDAIPTNFDALEVPSLVVQIVDYLQPMLTAYEAAIYWRLFRESIIAHGQQHTRASTRGLRKGTIVSSSGQSDDLSYNAVQNALSGLEKKGAISRVGDTTREGTPYKVSVPGDIPACVERMRQARDERAGPVDEMKELDFYNVTHNRLHIFKRDGYTCYKCGKLLTQFSATLDHIQPVSEGGNNSEGNLVTACLLCNSRRGSRPVDEFLQDK
jgi:hypothetical protein